MRIYSYALKSILYFLSFIFIICCKLAVADLPTVTVDAGNLILNQPTVVVSDGVLDTSKTSGVNFPYGMQLCKSGNYVGAKPRYRVAVCFSDGDVSFFHCPIAGYVPTALPGVQGQYMPVPGIKNLYFNITLKTISDGTLNLRDNDNGVVAQGDFNVSSYIPKGDYKNIVNPSVLTAYANDSSNQVDSYIRKEYGESCGSTTHNDYSVDNGAYLYITGQKIGYRVTVVATDPLTPGASSTSTLGITSTVYFNTSGDSIRPVAEYGQKLVFKIKVPPISCSISAAPNLNTKISADTLQNIYNGKPQDLFGTTNIILNCKNTYSKTVSNNVAVYLSKATGQVGTDGNYVPLLSDSSDNRITQKPFVYAVYNSKGVKQIAQSTPPTTFTKHLHLCDFNPLTISGSGEAPVQQCPFSISLLKNPAATEADKDAIKNISTISGTLNFKVAIE
ncbi:hypothetical protein [Cysteiniphilum halobium]|uniref:hypothetical protein n=1 Tax=Cysteiniphilum halobium TaxID=2219059 RepID=UPI000E648AC4|nr:hypothetical protein [Cysteiniphilum halobium]